MRLRTGCADSEDAVSYSGHDHSTPADGVELTRLLRNLAELVRLLAEVTTIEELLEIAAEHGRVGLRSASVSWSRLEPGTTTLRTLISVGELGPAEQRWPRDERYNLRDFGKLRKTMSDRQAWLHMSTVNCNDAPADAAPLALLAELGKQAATCAPVVVNNAVWGELNVTYARVEEANEADARIYLEVYLAIVESALARVQQIQSLESSAGGLADPSAQQLAELRPRGYEMVQVPIGTRDTHSVNGVCPILTERSGHRRDDRRLSAKPAMVAPHSRETLAAALEEVELNLIEDFRACSAPATESERIATEMGWPDLAMRARLTTADIAGRLGDVAACGRTATSVNKWAYQHRDGYLIARSHRLLATFFRRVGDAATALTHALHCVEYTTEDVAPRLRAGHYMTLALVLDLNGSYDDAVERFRTALRLVADDDPQMSLCVLNNMAFTAYERGDKSAAVDLVAQMRAIEQRHSIVLDGLYLDTISRVDILLERYAEAEETLRPVLEEQSGPLVTEGDTLAVCLVTVAEALLMRGLLDRAQVMLDHARQVCDERGLAAIGADVRLQQAQLYAQAGRHREAYEEHRRYHADTDAFRSAKRDARARALKATLETEEALRDREYFRQLAFHDALTGLHNRRYFEDQLPSILSSAAARNAPASLAIIDLDFFKRINDTLSHEVGDHVLQQVAMLLTAMVGPPGIVARLGGEEFVVVLPEMPASAVLDSCEAVRFSVSSFPWAALTGALPVTVSIGVVTTYGTTTPSALLGEADRNLYIAKRSGRDRVAATDTASV
jgi:diguanylate cyclase (GGDEF)-like protein